ncbi:MAG TPA: hypothetical protein VF522_13130 [Ramlibacter sp.]|uniref:hypothetical protein n=1 Tax=Ramlibacter sp. TaxID=1917967 RepID=UPI002ED3A9E9
MGPISASASSGASGGTSGTGTSGWGNGDWSINLAGSGQSVQAAGSLPLLLGIAALAGVAAWLLLRK